MKNIFLIFFFTIAISFCYPNNVNARMYNAISALAGCMTSGVVHELGHYVVANQVGTGKNKIYFLKKDKDGSFFLGLNLVSKIDERDRLQHTMAGIAASDYLFELTLDSYRRNPLSRSRWYKKGVMFCSGSDLLKYSLFTYTMNMENKYYDPVGIAEQTGLSKEWIIGIGAAQAFLNLIRIKSGRDALIPHFVVDVQGRKVAFKITKKF